MAIPFTVVAVLSVLVHIGQGQAPIISPLVIMGRLGDTVTFTCDARLPGEGVNNGLLVFDSNANDFVNFLNESGRLQRDNTGMISTFNFGALVISDNGTRFLCATTRGRSDIAVINVIYRPVITRVSPLGDPVTVTEGEPISIQLDVSANPQPAFEWRRNGVLVESGNGLTVALDSLMFTRASRELSGLYRLVANNSAGSSEYNFTLDVQYPPEFRSPGVTPNTFNCSVEGDTFTCASIAGASATFFCDVDANPMADVTISVPQNANVDISSNNIAINGVTHNHAGNYVCNSSSTQFSQIRTRSFRLYVGGPPRALGDVETKLNEGFIMVTWSYDNSVNPVPGTSFFATITEGGTQVGDPIPIDINLRSASVPINLKSGQKYRVSVVVRNIQGDSEVVSETFTYSNAVAISTSVTLSLIMLIIAVMN